MHRKVCLITGAGRGMGREAALMLAAEGAHLIIVDREGEVGTHARDEINGTGSGSAEFRYCDLSSLDEVWELAAGVLNNHVRQHDDLQKHARNF